MGQRAFGIMLGRAIRRIIDWMSVITLLVVTDAIEEPPAARCGAIGGLAPSALLMVSLPVCQKQNPFRHTSRVFLAFVLLQLISAAEVCSVLNPKNVPLV